MKSDAVKAEEPNPEKDRTKDRNAAENKEREEKEAKEAKENKNKNTKRQHEFVIDCVTL